MRWFVAARTSCALKIMLAMLCAAAGNGGEKNAVGEYLWLELGPCSPRSDGAMEQIVRICYGSFPHKRLVPHGLEDLTLYLAADPQRPEEERKWLALSYRLTPDSAEASVITPKGNHVALLAQARCGKRFFTSRLSFVLFGSAQQGHMVATATEPPQVNLRLLTQNEFDYWPQTQQPQILCLSRRNTPMTGIIYACDEHLGIDRLFADALGMARHTPPRDRALDWQGETARKHVVYVASYSAGDSEEVATCSRILHRSRFANRRWGSGLSIFGFCAAVCLMAERHRRRKERWQ